MPSKLSRTNLVIHSFAAAHAVGVLSMSLFGWGDELVLTLLTIIMIFGIARLIYNMPIDVTAILALMSCLTGYFLGTKCVALLHSVCSSSYGWNILTTVLVTEFLGWAIYFIARGARFARRR